MKVYNKDGRVANCITGFSCKRHGIGTSYSPVNSKKKNNVILPKTFNLFSEKQFVSLGEGENSSQYNSSQLEYYIENNSKKLIVPKNASTLRNELKSGKSLSSQEIRTIFLGKLNASSDKELEVVGPSDGTPLIIVIEHGFPRLRITSGNVIVQVLFSWGNSIKVENDAHVVVLINLETKASILASGQAQVRVVPSEASYGTLVGKDNSEVYLDDDDIDHHVRIITI
jgi:hypothetical protein